MSNKLWGGRFVIPAALIKVIAQVLLIEALLAPTRLILVCRPESGRIWGKDLIYQSKLITYCAELKLGIGDDYASLASNGCPPLVQGYAEFTKFFCQASPHFFTQGGKIG